MNAGAGWMWQVAEKLGVGSLRRRMLAESAASMHLGLHSSSAAEAFGQVRTPGHPSLVDQDRLIRECPASHTCFTHLQARSGVAHGGWPING